MTNFKQKLDNMMGDTGEQERRIHAGVRGKMLQSSTSSKKNWRINAVAAAFIVLTVVLSASLYKNYQFSQSEGQGRPYDPAIDIVEMQKLRAQEQFSGFEGNEFLMLPTLKTLTPLQYVAKEDFEVDGQTYYTVIERLLNTYEETVYKAGDIVRTMTNLSSHIPIYNDVYYEVLAVPGDRVVLHNGTLKVNGKEVKSSLMERYKQQNVTIAGGYDQLLNAREYVLLNRFPYENSKQGLTISPVHKIYGKVVGKATKEETTTIFFENDLSQTNYSPEQYFDLYLYDLNFGDGQLAKQLSVIDKPFPTTIRIEEYFAEASYREVHMISDDKAEITYKYKSSTGIHRYYMYKDQETNVWRWGL